MIHRIFLTLMLLSIINVIYYTWPIGPNTPPRRIGRSYNSSCFIVGVSCLVLTPCYLMYLIWSIGQ